MYYQQLYRERHAKQVMQREARESRRQARALHVRVDRGDADHVVQGEVRLRDKREVRGRLHVHHHRAVPVARLDNFEGI